MKLELEEGEIKCPKCKGKGYIKDPRGFKTACVKCLGCGKIDWIENVVGKQPGNKTDKPVYTQEYIQMVKVR